MFCVGCGSKLEADWGHCPKCGAARVEIDSSAQEGPEFETLTKTQAKKIMSPTTFAHWLASGECPVFIEDSEVSAFDLESRETTIGFLKFGFWFVGEENIPAWKEMGYPLMDFFFEGLEHFSVPEGFHPVQPSAASDYLGEDELAIWKRAGKPAFSVNSEGEFEFQDLIGQFRWSTVTNPISDEDVLGGQGEPAVSYEDAKKELDSKTYDALVAAGKPDLVRREGSIVWKDPLTKAQMKKYGMSMLSPEAGRIWAAAGYPDVNEFLAGLEEQFGNLDEDSEEHEDDVHYVQSDQEFKSFFGKQAFKWWKSKGRPNAVILNGQDGMLEVQWQFENHYGYRMSDHMVEAWFFSGCPDIRRWDVEGSIRIYEQTVLNMIEAQNGGGAGSWGGLGSDLTQIVDDLIHTCTRCGSEKRGSVCPYCQGRELF